jgi:PhzF family phenazine biosynthesis protein
MTNSLIIYHVDAFTSKAFRGNPAAVCMLDKEISVELMQNIAAEMNLSETAFVFPGKHERKIRFYTPAAEIDLCGHATLSASHILYENGIVNVNEKITFLSKAGKLEIRKVGEWITMNFPAYPIKIMKITDEFKKVTGTVPMELYQSAFGWTLALLKNEDEVRNFAPDFKLMKNSAFGDLIITATTNNPEFDFCVRCFAPALGIDEDPVTGSAHCALTPFWNMKTGKLKFNSHQVSKRSGILRVELLGERVEISGQAITIIKGEMNI